MEHRALGKGLSALIPEKPSSEKPESVSSIKTNRIRGNTLQPRTNYDKVKLDELIASIKEKGVLQPILVREKGDGYEVIAGERRLRAARALNMEEVPVIIKSANDQEALVLALIENIQRQELNAIEEAQAYKRLIEEFNFTQDIVAQSVGKNRSTISNLLRLLKLPDEIQKRIFDGTITEGHARALVAIEDDREQKRFFELTLKKGLSVRELESLIRTGIKISTRKIKSKIASPDQYMLTLQEELQKFLGTKVRILAQKKRGKIVVEYYSPDDLERIIKKIARIA